MTLQLQSITRSGPFWADVNCLALEAFPPEEYLAPDTLVEMAKADNFDFWALTDAGSFVGFMVVQTYEALVYLFFLAIDSQARSMGYGSRAIEALKEAYPGKKQVVDFEMLDDTAPNAAQREKRRAFYIRNGYKETGLFLTYLGVDYEVLCMGDHFDPEEFKAMMATLRVEGFHPVYFTK